LLALRSAYNYVVEILNLRYELMSLIEKLMQELAA